MNTLDLSSSDSYQSLSDLTIECCVCLEEILNEDSCMPACKHSWCKECDNKMKMTNIRKCPVCRENFQRILKKGKWRFENNIYGGKWTYEKGTEDSKRKLFIRKVQSVFSNLFLTPYVPSDIGI